MKPLIALRRLPLALSAIALLILVSLLVAQPAKAAEPLPAHLLQGAMQALQPTEPPRQAPSQTPFETADGREMTLESLDGRWRLVNLWATWCAPCREEMPALDRLAEAYSGTAFEVITIASGQHDASEIARFMEENAIRLLPRYQSPGSAIARDLGVLGLPTSVLLDPAGHEVARLTGSADWFSAEARAVIDYLLEQGSSTLAQ